MILDQGPAVFYHRQNTADPGAMPSFSEVNYFRSWYGQLSFETSPAWPTEAREEAQIDARIRVLQNLEIKNLDLVALSPEAGAPRFRVRRAYHGTDDDSGEPITDLSLQRITP